MERRRGTISLRFFVFALGLIWSATGISQARIISRRLPVSPIRGQARPAAAPAKTRTAPARAAAPVQDPVAALTLQPSSIVLDGANARQHLVVTAEYRDGIRRDITSEAMLSISDPRVAGLSKPGILAPAADGAARVTATFHGLSASQRITVLNAAHRSPVSFTNELVPLFSKVGCSQGTCHGAAAGQNGFKLSLRGYDPTLDFEQIVKESGGKRVDQAHPEKSLVFLKPTGGVPHGGGIRLPEGSPERALLLRWLQEGMAPPDDRVAIRDLVVWPTERLIASPGITQQILVTARYSDGSGRDVTDMARFSSNDDTIASVSDSGLVTARGGGEAAIMVSYGGLVRAPRIMVPISKAPVTRADFPSTHPIDDAVFNKLFLLHIQPSPLCTDQEFLRRASLDITGTTPGEEEVKAFLQDKRTDKRSRLVDDLLSRSSYVDFRTLKLADMLRVNSNFLKEGSETYYQWIHDQVEANTPWDKFVHQLLLARGPTFQNGPANFYRVAGDPTLVGETTAETFLGVRMQCARCHNHPFESWTQNDYYSLAACFARVASKNGPEVDESQIYIRTSGEVNHPKTKTAMAPKPLGGPALDVENGADRRAAFADWLTAPSNLSFAREAVNRVWADFFGKGIIDPVDDVRVSNPPSNEQLLDLLANQFIQHTYDVKWLIRYITTSRSYQLSSEPTPSNLLDTRHFARALPRRMSAEQVLDAIDYVTGQPDRFGNLPLGTRAIQITDARTGNYFLQVLGKPRREILCACERDMQPNLSQSLHLINSGDINGKIASENGWLHRQIKSGASDTDIVNRLYLRALGRPPSAQELKLALGQVQTAPGPAFTPPRTLTPPLTLTPPPTAPTASIKAPASTTPGASVVPPGALARLKVNGSQKSLPNPHGAKTSGKAVSKPAGRGAGAMNPGTMDSNSMGGETMSGESMFGGAMNNRSMSGETMNGSSMNGSSMNGSSMNGSSMNGSSMKDRHMSGASKNGSMEMGNMAGESMSGGSMAGGTMSGGSMAGGTMEGSMSSSRGGSDTPGKTGANPRGASSPGLEARTSALEDVAWAILNSQEFLFNH